MAMEQHRQSLAVLLLMLAVAGVVLKQPAHLLVVAVLVVAELDQKQLQLQLLALLIQVVVAAVVQAIRQGRGLDITAALAAPASSF